ncbi:hypothetical protein, conserved, partial [Eimeria necatrix]
QSDGGAPTGAPASSARKPEDAERGPQGALGPPGPRRPQGPPGGPLSPDSPVPFLTATETQQKVERWWRQGAPGALAERGVHAEIERFKATYVLVPGLDAALAQRLRRLTAACCRHLPQGLAESKEAARVMERFVWLEAHDRLWPFFLEAGESKQKEIERGLQIFRTSVASSLEALGLRRELRGTDTGEAGKEVGKVPSMLLPHEKLQQLCRAVDAIHRAFNSAVAAAAASKGSLGLAREEAVEVCCEDLVALLVLALAEGGAAAFVASYLHMLVLLLQQSREARMDKEAFYLTALHSALTFLSQARAVQTPQPLSAA